MDESRITSAGIGMIATFVTWAFWLTPSVWAVNWILGADRWRVGFSGSDLDRAVVGAILALLITVLFWIVFVWIAGLRR